MTLTTQSPTSGELGSAQPVTTLLGKGSEFEGKLSFEGTVRVDGKMTGEIFTDDVLIVGEGAEVNAEDSESGATPLDHAAHFGRVELLDLLIRNGAEVNHRNKADKTALKLALENGQDAAAALLRSHGAKE